MRQSSNPIYSTSSALGAAFRIEAVDTNMRSHLPVIGNMTITRYVVILLLAVLGLSSSIQTASAQSSDDCAICTGGDGPKVTSLTFRFNGDSEKFILIQDKDNEYTYFSGFVQPGGEFTADGTDTDGKFHRNDLDIIILSGDPGLPYEGTLYDGGDIDVIKVHVSCSKPLFYGMDLAAQEGKEDPNVEDLGKLTLIGGLDTNQDQICEPADPEDAFCYLNADNDGISDSPDGISFLSGDFVETAIGLTGTDHIEAITFISSTGILYGADEDAFGSIDLATGVFTQIGLFGSGNGALGSYDFDDVDGLAWDPFTRIMYASARKEGGEADVLFQVNPTTGGYVSDAFGLGIDYVVVEQINGLDDIDDIAISTDNGMMYAIQNSDGEDSRLITINKLTGATTDIGDLDVPNVEGLGFHPDGRLLGVNGDSFRSVMEIPIAPFTGLTTPISNLGVNGWDDYEGIACLTEPDNRIEGTVYLSPDRIDLRLLKTANVTTNKGVDVIEYEITVSNDNTSPVAGPNPTSGNAAPGVTVNLYRDKGTIGIYDPLDEFVASTITGPSGGYHFEVSANGTFIVRVDLSSITNNAYDPTDNEEAVSFVGFGEVSAGNDFYFFTITAATNVIVFDYFPDDASYVSYDADQGLYDSNTNEWDVGTVTPGATVALRIQATPLSNGTLENCAEVKSADQQDIDSMPGNGIGNAEDEEDCWSRPRIDMEIMKSSEQGPESNQRTYTLRVSNNPENANVAATDIEVTDVLPANVVFIEAFSTSSPIATGPTSVTPGTLTWNIATLNPGESVLIAILVNVTGDVGVNCAEITQATGHDVDSTPGNGPNDEDDYDCDDLVDIEVTKTASRLNPEFGDQFTYTMTVENKGSNTATNLVLTENLPSGVTYISHVASGLGVYDVNTGLWLIPELLPGAFETLDITVQVSGAAGSLSNGNYLLHNHPGNDLAPPGYGLRLDELFGGLKGITFDFDHADSEVIMTINGSTVTIQGVVYGGQDAGATYAPGSDGLWDVYFEYENVVSSVPGDDDLFVSDADSETSFGTISPQYNSAWFYAGDVFDLGDKSDGSYSFRLGDLDDDFGYNGYPGISGWGWLKHGQNGNLNHAPISDWIFTAVPIIDHIENCVELTSMDQTDSDSFPNDGTGDDYACVTTTHGDPKVDLSLMKDVDSEEASVGDVINYTITVNNDANAGATATNVVVQDFIPAQLQILTTNPTANVSTNAVTNEITWLLPAIAPGESFVLSIEVRIIGAGVIENCAEIIDADQEDRDDIYGDGTGEDHDCAVTTTNDPYVDLSLHKAVFPSNPSLGDVVDYEIRVRNDASATETAFGVQVVDNIPSGLSVQSTDPISNVTVNNQTNVVSWFIPSLAPGAEVVLHIYAKVDHPGRWKNCAEIMAASGFDTDSTPGNGVKHEDDYDCATTNTPDPTIDLSLEKTVDNATPALGAGITFTLAVTNDNAATEAATGVVVEDQLPGGVTIDPGFSNPNVTVSLSGLVTWNVGSVGIGDTKYLDIPVIVTANVLQQNCAQITAADQDDVDSTPDNGIGNGEDDQDCVTFTPNLTPPDLMCYVVADNEDHLGSGDVLTYFTNGGIEVAIGITGTDNINAIEYVGATSKLYASDGGTFGTLNAGNGVFSPIGSYGSGIGSLGARTFTEVDGLALDPFTGVLYGTVRMTGADLLIQINLLTGAAVPNAFGVGHTYVVIPAVNGFDEVDDIAIHPDTGVMYGVMNGGGNSLLVTIDKVTGVATFQANIDVPHVRGLTFKANGDLIGTLGSTDNEARRIHLGDGTTTLVVTLGIGGNFDYEAITCNTHVPNSLSGTVFLDNNEDALLDAGDVGQAGVTVNLYRDEATYNELESNDLFVGSTVTDVNGEYTFSMIAKGRFIVQTDLGTYPAGAELTTDNIETAHFLGYGEHDSGNDFGFKLTPVVLGSIGDEVYSDDNANGLRDPGEAGLTGILIRLYSGMCPVNSSPIATRVSNLTGGYDFTMLPAGTYCVDVDNQTVPPGYVLTTANDPMTVILGNGEDYNLADFGFYFDPAAVEADLELTKEVDTSSPALDGIVEFTITVTNYGPSDATGLIVRDIIPVGLVFQDYSSSRGSYEANKLGYWTIGDLAVGQTETLKIRTKVVITNMIENIAQVSHVDQEDPDSTPGNGVPSEDDQDRALVESRGPGSVGDIIRVECADMGTVNALQYSVYDGQIYAGTEVGTVHISNDDGQNWPAFLNTDNDAPVRDIVVDTNGRVYVGSFGDGVYRSTNEGDSWTNIGPAGGAINDLDVDENTNYIYAADYGRVIVYNGGTWSTVGAGTNPFTNDQVLAVVYNEQNNTVLAASAASGVWKYEAGTWTDASNGLPNGKINVLTQGPNGEILAGHNNRGVFIFGGGSWFQFGMGLDSEPIESIGTGPNGELLAGSR